MTRYFLLWDCEEEAYLGDDNGHVTTLFPEEAELFSNTDYPTWLDAPCFEHIERRYLPEDQQNYHNGHPPLFTLTEE